MIEWYLYTFGSIALLSVVAIFLLSPETGILLFFLAGISIQYLERVSLGTISGLDVAGIGIPILLIAGLTIRRNLFYEVTKDRSIVLFLILLFFLLFTGVIYTGVLYPPPLKVMEFPEKLGIWAKFVNGFTVLLVVSAFFQDKKKVDGLLTCMLLTLAIPGSIAFWEIVSGNTHTHGSGIYKMPWAFFHHPNVIAYGLVMLFPIVLFKHSQAGNSKGKIFWTCLIGLVLFMIFFTYRRAVWVGLLIQLFIWFFVLQKGRFKVLYGYLTVVLVICLIAFQMLFTFQDRMSDIVTFFSNIPEVFDDKRYNYLFAGRWGFFRANLSYLFKEPFVNLILGNGIGGTAYAAWSEGVVGGNHNCYFILLIEFGLVCFVMYMALFLSLFGKAWRLLKTSDQFFHNYARMFLVLLTGYMVMGLGTHLFYMLTSGVWIFWGLSGALLGLTRMQMQRSVRGSSTNKGSPGFG